MKPQSVEVYPIYICPGCESRHCESLEFVNKVGKILCGCGNLIELDPISTFRITPVYPPPKKQNKNYRKEMEEVDDFFERNNPNKKLKVSDSFPYGGEVDKNTDTPEDNKSSIEKKHKITKTAFNDAVFFLLKLGWKKRTATKKVEEFSKIWSETNKSDIDESNSKEFATYLFFNHSRVK